MRPTTGAHRTERNRSLSHVRRRLLTAALSAVAGLALAVGTAGTASAASDLDCSDFSYQESAQAVLDLDRSDPNRLDANHDGVACESLPHRPVVTPPTTTTTTTTAPAGTTTTTTAASTTTSSTTTSSTATSNSTATSTTGSTVTTTSGAVGSTSATTTGATPTTTPAGDTKNCSDFATQALAQAFLLADPTDPSRLDADHDGIACEDSFGTQNQQVAVIPNGAVRTGGLPPR